MKKTTAKIKDKPDRDVTGITYTQNFAAEVRKGPNGKKTIVLKSPRWYHFQVSKFKEGEEVTLVIHSRKPKRSEQQNRYYWGVYLPMISEHTGEPDLDKLHELFKGKFLTKGVVEVLGEKVRLKKSTTELGVGDFCQYVMDIETLTGVIAPPTENYGLTALERALKDAPESQVEYPNEQLTPTF